jgi:hypothetical protein
LCLGSSGGERVELDCLRMAKVEGVTIVKFTVNKRSGSSFSSRIVEKGRLWRRLRMWLKQDDIEREEISSENVRWWSKMKSRLHAAWDGWITVWSERSRTWLLRLERCWGRPRRRILCSVRRRVHGTSEVWRKKGSPENQLVLVVWVEEKNRKRNSWKISIHEGQQENDLSSQP